MIAIDTNLLVYAHREDSPFHRQAFHCIEELAEGKRLWCVPWPCIHEFFSIVTHPRIYSPPTPTAIAIEQIEAWMESPSIAILSEFEGYWDELKTVVEAGAVCGPMVHDARIAALCILHGVDVLWTADRDFSRFPGIQKENPLVNRSNTLS